MQRNYTIEDVKRYREETECSARAAAGHFEKRYLLECVHIAHRNKDFDLLCDVVRELVSKMRFE